MMGRRSRGDRGAERGAAAVEFALIVPFLVLLLLGIISYGFMLNFRQSLSQAASEGARAAAVTLVDAERTTQAQQAVGEVLTASGVTCASGQLRLDGRDVGTCDVSPPENCAGATAVGGVTPQCVTVSLVYNYDDAPMVPDFPGVGAVLPDRLTYSSTARVS